MKYQNSLIPLYTTLFSISLFYKPAKISIRVQSQDKKFCAEI